MSCLSIMKPPAYFRDPGKEPKCAQLFDQLFKKTTEPEDKGRIEAKQLRRPLARLESNNQSQRRRRPKAVLTTYSTDEQSPQDQRDDDKKKRRTKKAVSIQLHDSIIGSGDNFSREQQKEVVKKIPAKKDAPAQKKPRGQALDYPDPTQDEVLKAFLADPKLPDFEEIAKQDLVIVTEEIGASRNPYAKPETPNLKQLIQVFDDQTASVIADNSKRKTHSRRYNITPVLSFDIDDVPPPVEVSLQIPSSSPPLVSPQISGNNSLKRSIQSEVNHSINSVQTEVFVRGLNHPDMVSTPVLSVKERGSHRVFRKPSAFPPKNRRVGQIKSSELSTPVRLIADPGQPLTSSPVEGNALKSFGHGLSANVSGISRPDSRNNHETGFSSRYSTRSSTIRSKTASRHDSNDSTLSQHQETMVAKTPVASRKSSSHIPVSVEKLDIPFMTDINGTVIPQVTVQSATSFSRNGSSSESGNLTVRNLDSGKRTDNISLESDVWSSTLSGHPIDPDLIEPMSVFMETPGPCKGAPKSRLSLEQTLASARSVLFSRNVDASFSRKGNPSLIQETPKQDMTHKSMKMHRTVMSTADVSRLNVSRIRSIMSIGGCSRNITMKSHEASQEANPREVTAKDIRSLMESFAVFSTTRLVHGDGQHEEMTPEAKVLSLCDPQEITVFKEVFTKDILAKIEKIGEGSYGEIYMSQSPDGLEIVLKLIPFELGIDYDVVFSQLLPELMICTSFRRLKESTVNGTPNFIDMMRAACVRGKFPKKLITKWHEYDERKRSENPNPEEYPRNHLHLVMVLNNGGTDIESASFKSATESLGCFLQIAMSLAAAEAEFEFEHRDLHWGNVLIAKTNQETLDYYVSRMHYEVPTGGVLVSIIDFSLSRMSKEGYVVFDDLSKQEDIFTGDAKVDYQFEVYRKMRKENENNWEKYCPKTNVFWMEYMLDKLIHHKKYSARNKDHIDSMNHLKTLLERISDYNSAQDFIESSLLANILESFSS